MVTNSKIKVLRTIWFTLVVKYIPGNGNGKSLETITFYNKYYEE